MSSEDPLSPFEVGENPRPAVSLVFRLCRAAFFVVSARSAFPSRFFVFFVPGPRFFESGAFSPPFFLCMPSPQPVVLALGVLGRVLSV